MTGTGKIQKLFKEGKSIEDILKIMNADKLTAQKRAVLTYRLKNAYKNMQKQNLLNDIKIEKQETEPIKEIEKQEPEPIKEIEKQEPEPIKEIEKQEPEPIKETNAEQLTLEPIKQIENKPEANLLTKIYSNTNTNKANVETFTDLNAISSVENTINNNLDNKKDTNNIDNRRIKFEKLTNAIPTALNEGIFKPLHIDLQQQEIEDINTDTAIMIKRRLNISDENYDIYNVVISYISPFISRIPKFFKIAQEQLAFKKEKSLAQQGKLTELEVIKEPAQTQKPEIKTPLKIELNDDDIIERLKNNDAELLKKLNEVNSRV